MKIRPLLLLSIILFLLSPILTYAQNQHHIVVGKVTDSLHQNISYATVQLKKLNLKTTTNKSGEFQLKNISSGTYTLRISMTGFEANETQITLKENDTLKMDFILKTKESDLKEVIVSASRKAESLAQTPSSVTILTAKEISALSVTKTGINVQLLQLQTTFSVYIKKWNLWTRASNWSKRNKNRSR